MKRKEENSNNLKQEDYGTEKILGHYGEGLPGGGLHDGREDHVRAGGSSDVHDCDSACQFAL
jgi:hypothetical protein